ncbi:MAG: S1 family peptidase, partial [Acidimicrobiales bacterium]
MALAVVAPGQSAAQPPDPGAHPPAVIAGVAADRGISRSQAAALLSRQDQAHALARALPGDVLGQSAGQWFDASTGKLTIAVPNEAAAQQARDVGADAVVVPRSQAQLDRLTGAVRQLVGNGVPGVDSWGIDVRANRIGITVNRTKETAATNDFLRRARALGDGIEITGTQSSPRQQSGDVQPGEPWWPGSESNCSNGFPATDAQGGKQMVTAGHCTNDADQPAYGASGQQNRMGTSNVGGTHSVNGHEGDMGVVAVDQPGWNLSAVVDTWGNGSVNVTGAADAMVGDQVCHSGNTSHWQCGEVKYT